MMGPLGGGGDPGMSGPVPVRVSYTAKVGAVLLIVGVAQFVIAMGAVQAHYPGYSDLQNYISDLGNTTSSPAHAVFNTSIEVLGVLAFVGILLTWNGFPRGANRLVGLSLLLLASVAAIVVGLFPENVNPTVHGLASLLVFAPGGVGLVVVGSSLTPSTSWKGWRAPSVVLGAITLLSLLYYVPTQASNSTFDPGLIERLIVAPILIWGFAVGVRFLRVPSAL
jgi:hypothetical membrane protein